MSTSINTPCAKDIYEREIAPHNPFIITTYFKKLNDNQLCQPTKDFNKEFVKAAKCNSKIEIVITADLHNFVLRDGEFLLASPLVRYRKCENFECKCIFAPPKDDPKVPHYCLRNIASLEEFNLLNRSYFIDDFIKNKTFEKYDTMFGAYDTYVDERGDPVENIKIINSAAWNFFTNYNNISILGDSILKKMFKKIDEDRGRVSPP